MIVWGHNDRIDLEIAEVELLAEADDRHDELGKNLHLRLWDLLLQKGVCDLFLRHTPEHWDGHPNSLAVYISDIHTSLVMEEDLQQRQSRGERVLSRLTEEDGALGETKRSQKRTSSPSRVVWRQR